MYNVASHIVPDFMLMDVTEIIYVNRKSSPTTSHIASDVIACLKSLNISFIISKSISMQKSRNLHLVEEVSLPMPALERLNRKQQKKENENKSKNTGLWAKKSNKQKLKPNFGKCTQSLEAINHEPAFNISYHKSRNINPITTMPPK